MLFTPPSLKDIIQAHELIREQIHLTPVLQSQAINQLAKNRLVFKCENFQKVGAFKFRGASHAIAKLSNQELSKGVITHSSGNHAAALALAARNRNISAHIVMPENSPGIKIKAVESYGGIIHFCKPGLSYREEKMLEVQANTQSIFIHPYHHFDIIAGQGTACLEFLNQETDLDLIIAPVGGGGLLSGTAIAAKACKPEIKVLGAEPVLADDAWKGYYSGKRQNPKPPLSIADGLLTSLGVTNFKIILELVDDIIRVEEKEIIAAMRIIWERMKIIVEPSAAVGLAAVLKFPGYFSNLKVGIILSGGNVSLDKLPFTN